MNKNFVINQSVYLVHNDIFYDLHNDYKLRQLSISSNNKEVLMTWIKCENEWVNKNNNHQIMLIFKGVSHFEISENFVPQSTDTIQEIGYKDPFDFDLDWLIFEDQHEFAQHLFLRFQNDEYIRIYSDTVNFCIESQILQESVEN